MPFGPRTTTGVWNGQGATGAPASTGGGAALTTGAGGGALAAFADAAGGGAGGGAPAHPSNKERSKGRVANDRKDGACMAGREDYVWSPTP
jgi:hypothetical protein